MGGVGNGQQGGGDFWSELTNTNQNLTLLQEQIQAVRSAHQKSLVSIPLSRLFSTDPYQSATDSGATMQVDQLNSEAKTTREQCKNQIKQLFKMAKGDRAMKTQVETVKTRFTGLLNEHQVVEKEFRKKVKDRVERQYRIVNPQATEEEVRQVTESDNPQVFSQAVSYPNHFTRAGLMCSSSTRTDTVLLEVHTEKYRNDMLKSKRSKRPLPNSHRCSLRWPCWSSSKTRPLSTSKVRLKVSTLMSRLGTSLPCIT